MRQVPHVVKALTVHDFQRMKNANQKISMVTCYDYTSAKILSQTSIDCVLVGDSVAMTVHGYSTTVAATIPLMLPHIQAVAKGAPNKFIVGDMPFCSYRKSLSKSMQAVEALMRAGAHAIKLEGADEHNLMLVSHIVNSGVPVMGHVGLTPQSVHALGGFKVQGRDEKAANKIKNQAKLLEEAGCFAIVLEGMPCTLAKEITASVHIPTIGIGAGPMTDGQVLVFQDMLGLYHDLKPKFVKTYLNGFELFQQALNQYDQEVKSGVFPDLEKHAHH